MKLFTAHSPPPPKKRKKKLAKDRGIATYIHIILYTSTSQGFSSNPPPPKTAQGDIHTDLTPPIHPIPTPPTTNLYYVMAHVSE